ncbi:hypothetical protein ACH36K_11055 [Clostridium sp. MB05]|jgi:hypothetical protein|uniref:hypothetical protein n=1 Tax=Clostridium sp. MB05 TaxID=3376682 RepID=UPI0039825846
MKKVIILLLSAILILYACTNTSKTDINEEETKKQEQSDSNERRIENKDDTIIFRATSKESNVDIKSLIKKVEKDLNSKGLSSKVINRDGNSLYIMTTGLEVKDIRVHKLNIENKSKFNIHEYITKYRNENYEALSKSLENEEYLIIPINIRKDFQEEAISWITSDGTIKVYEITESETYEE